MSCWFDSTFNDRFDVFLGFQSTHSSLSNGFSFGVFPSNYTADVRVTQAAYG